MRGVAILGSTGSIGVATLEVLKRQTDGFRVIALTAGSNADLLDAQRVTWNPEFVGLVDGNGPDCLIEAATHPEVDIVVNAVVGFAGLDATLAALRAGKRVALANKESLVVGGELVLRAAREGGGELVPVDSEHSAVLQCLAGTDETPTRLILTASGGPFREWEPERVARATRAEALQHPTWRMGDKITVDSATLANKALEVIEAHFLFGLDFDQVEVVVHPQSIIHAFVEFADGSILAQLGLPSMELPILYALTYPERLADSGIGRLDPVAIGALTFEPVRTDVFRAFECGVASGRRGGTSPAVFNAANEVAVGAFLEERIPFSRIADTLEQVCGEHVVVPATSIETLYQADTWARTRAMEVLS
jgi:1-deoxy-D-xylulose-5-phosphate reductoisomerase